MTIHRTSGVFGFILKILRSIATDYEMPLSSGQLELYKLDLPIQFVQKMAH